MSRWAVNADTRLITKEGKLFVTSKYMDRDAPVLKGWESFSGWYWFATELNDDGTHFGFVQGFEEELGYFSEKELVSIGERTGNIWPIKEEDLPYAGRRD